MQQTLRAFIAVELSPSIRTRAQKLIADLSGTSANVKWVETYNLHWTLHFLGNIPVLELPRVCEALTEATAELPGFEIEAFGAGAFPEPWRPRTVWIGPGAGADAMITLHDCIQERLSDLGFRTEHRRFRPHITLGRVRGDVPGNRELGELIVANSEFAAGQMVVDEVVVFSSEHDRSGPRYEAVGHASLLG
jgi:2'-5' RNA ligase